MPALSISKAWDETKAVVAHDGRLLAAVAMALIVLPQIVFAVVGAPVGAQATVLAQIVYIAVTLLGLVAQISLNRLAVGPSVTVRDAIAQGFIRVGSVLLALLLVIIGLMIIAVALAMLLGAVKLVNIPMPGQTPPASFVVFLLLVVIAAFAIFQLVFPLAAAETGNPIRLISRSWHLGHRHYLRLLGFTLIVFVGLGIIAAIDRFAIGSAVLLALGPPNPGSFSALLLGLIAGIIQGAFTVVTAVMLARIYVQLAGDGERTADVFR